MKKLNMIAIITDKCVYISDHTHDRPIFLSYLSKLLFDGFPPTPTYNKDWFSIRKLPIDVEMIIPPKKINFRYELKQGFTPNDRLPYVIGNNDYDMDSWEFAPLYDHIWDMTEETKETVNYNITIIDEISDFQIVKQDFPIESGFLDTLRYHPVVLTHKPCSLSRENSYKIIRDHIKANINLKYARVTSDFDFCMAVKKSIKYSHPEAVVYDMNYNPLGKAKRPKMGTKYLTHAERTILEIAPKAYQNYNVVNAFSGNSYEDMQNNINNYLKELMDMINEPLVECPHCLGTGVKHENIRS